MFTDGESDVLRPGVEGTGPGVDGVSCDERRCIMGRGEGATLPLRFFFLPVIVA